MSNEKFIHIHLGTYTCIASSPLTGIATISASDPLFVEMKAPKIVSIPSNVCAVKGKNVNFSCGGSGIPLPTITWYNEV